MTLTLIATAGVLLGVRHSASGAGCSNPAAGPACADIRAPDAAHPDEIAAEPSLVGALGARVSPPPPDGLFASRMSILGGAGLPQTPLRSGASPTSLRWPIVGPLTQPFGVPDLGVGLPHAGVDIGQEPGSPVRAAQAGRIVLAGGDPCCGLGYWVEINHGDRYSTRYGHLMRPPLVLAGDFVSQGQVIGFSGNTGFSTGPHLHFEVRYDGVPIDPLRVLSQR